MVSDPLTTGSPSWSAPDVFVLLDEGKLPVPKILAGPCVLTEAGLLFHRKPASREMRHEHTDHVLLPA